MSVVFKRHNHWIIRCNKQKWSVLYHILIITYFVMFSYCNMTVDFSDVLQGYFTSSCPIINNNLGGNVLPRFYVSVGYVIINGEYGLLSVRHKAIIENKPGVSWLNSMIFCQHWDVFIQGITHEDIVYQVAVNLVQLFCLYTASVGSNRDTLKSLCDDYPDAGEPSLCFTDYSIHVEKTRGGIHVIASILHRQGYRNMPC